mmetsp:Transcript_30404/g.37578  ORF Transcript_30404/g.37578 Transcript_30404/m.37578 type:complete len:478 (-) Transcript_30404:909-2342(-)
MDFRKNSPEVDTEVTELGNVVENNLNISTTGSREADEVMETLDEDEFQVVDFGDDDVVPEEEEEELDDTMEESEVTVSEQYETGKEGFFDFKDSEAGAGLSEKGGESRVDLPEDNAIAVFSGHTDAVYSVNLSSDGQKAVSGSGDDKGMVWETKSGNKLFELQGHTDTVIATSFNNSDTMVATASYDATIRLYNASTGEFIRSLEGPSSEIEWMQWHPKGDVIACGSEDGTAWIWDASSGNCLAVLAGHEAPVACGMFTHNGKRLLTGSLDGTVRLWDPRSSACVHTFSGHNWHEAGVLCMDLHPTEPMVAAGGQDGTVRIGRLDTKKVLFGFNHNNENPKVLIPGDANSNTSSRIMREGEEEVCCSVESVSFCDTSSLFASAGTDNTVKIWDLTTQACRYILGHNDSVVKVQFIPGSTFLISCSSDKTCRVWDARSGKEVKIAAVHKDMILDFAYKPEAGVLVTSSDDKTCRVLAM